MTEQEKYILEQAETHGIVTNWHWNDFFLSFWDKFYNDLSVRQAKKKFSYYARKLVKIGVLEKGYKAGLGQGGYYHYGVRFQTTWMYKK